MMRHPNEDDVNVEEPSEQRPQQISPPYPSRWLAEALSEQPWHEIGNCAPPVAATSDVRTIIDQLASILELRLKDLAVYRHNQTPLPPVGRNGEQNAFVVDDDTGELELRPQLRKELKAYVSSISHQYNRVHFHKLEHAAHVTVSANKLLSMLIKTPDQSASDGNIEEERLIRQSAPGSTRQIRSHQSPQGDAAADGGKHSSSNNGHRVSTSSLLTARGGRRVSSCNRRGSLQHVEIVSATQTNDESLRAKRQGSLGSSSGDDHHGKDSFGLENDPTFGIGSDPLARFAVVFAALIHDVDHRGINNAQLVEEGDDLAITHNDSSVLEQHSLQVGFSTLMGEDFALLKECIMPTSAERATFRKLVIGIVLATDISSPDRMQLSQSKWSEAFVKPMEQRRNSLTNKINSHHDSGGDQEQHPSLPQRSSSPQATAGDESKEAGEAVARRRHSMYTSEMSKKELLRVRLGIRQSLHLDGKLIDIYSESDDGDVKLRASAVLDLIMNVADVAHTMQGFHVFCKWNRHLYRELHAAYRAGRNSFGGDPSQNWYQNQINFFDAYIIPLAEKLEACGAFGSQGSILLYFAMENRRRWTVEGFSITCKMIAAFEAGEEDDDDGAEDEEKKAS